MSEKEAKNGSKKELTQQLEKSLARAENDSRAKTAFQVKISHDVRTNLGIVLGYADMARRNIDNKEQLLSCLDKIDVYGRSLLGLINQVLDMTDVESAPESNGAILTMPKDQSLDEDDLVNVSPLSVLSGKRVLIVDDNEMNLEIIREIMEEYGLLTDEARNGFEALTAASTGPYYDFILMDINMPKMNGFEASAAIRKLDDEARSGVPIIALSASPFKKDDERSVNAGISAAHPKPIHEEELIRLLASFVKQG